MIRVRAARQSGRQRLWCLALALAACVPLPTWGAACGPIPIITEGIGPGYGGTKLVVDNNVTVDNGSSHGATQGTTLTNQVVPEAGGSPITMSVSLPGLSPTSFPSTSGSYSVAKNGSGTLAAPPYHLASLTVNDGGTLTLAPGEYFVDTFVVGKNATIRVGPVGAVRLSTNSDVSIDQGTSINVGPDTGNAADFVLFAYGAHEVRIGKNASFVGAIYAPDTGARIRLDQNSTLIGGAVTGGELEVDKNVGLIYTATVQAELATLSTCPPTTATLHHLQIEHASGSGLTCTPSTLTIRACQDASCSTPYTGGVTGSASASAGTVVWPAGASFTIAAGSSITSLTTHVTVAGSATLGASATTPAATNATTCNFGAPACTFSAADAGLLFDVPDHVAEQSQSVSVSAVRKSDNSLACVPAFASVSRAVTWRCSTANPASGTLPVRVGGRALNAANNASAACDASGQAVTLAFNASGVATTTVQYADVGQMSLSATYTGSVATTDAGLVMSGSDGFIAAPASFAFSGISAAPLRAGVAFAATLTALNSAGAATPNFGREGAPESATLGFTRRSPGGAGAANGSFTGSLGAFSNGVATSANLVWSEVGTGDLSATLQSGSYLGSGLTASGSTGSAGAVGRFTPHHFDVAVTPACSGSFSYAGQPFSVTVTARNGLTPAGTTLNYDGSAATSPNFAQALTLSEATALGVGSLSNAGIAASAFAAGVASASPSYAFTAKATAPQTLVLRATDADGIASTGYVEGQTPLRSGRLRLANSFGSATQPLQLPVLAEYWSGNAWLLNSADSCTTVPAAAVAISNARNALGSASAATTSASAITVAGGNGTLMLTAPAPAGSSLSVDLALNLGSGVADQSCLASHPATVGAARAWLRSFNGACAASADRDPAARASFGIYSAESRKTVHVRELY